MRYWIWWNDLTQGPFELDELTSLKAFSEDLLVCMEDRQEWLPASRIADLSAAVEQLRGRSAAPRTPPPAPPKRSPNVTPLQGEFFGDPPGQQSFIEPDDGPKGSLAYHPVSGESDTPAWSYFEGRVTMPFHFAHQPVTGTATVMEIPRPKLARVLVEPQPVIRESPVRKPVEKEPIPLSVVESTPILAESVVPRDTTPPFMPSFDDLPTEERRPQWLPWIAGVVFVLAALGSISYWVIDRASTHSAISEADHVLPPPRVTHAPRPSVVVPVPPAVVMPSPIPSKVVGYTQAKSKKAALAAKKKAVAAVTLAPVHRKPVSAAPKDSAPSVPSVVIEPVAVPATPPAPAAVNPWKGKQNDAIVLVQNKKLPKSKSTIGDQARAMLQEMHEKELLHAAETGERLYLPDKISWSALDEEDSRYRVYLNFLAWQSNGERVQNRSYQFLVDVQKKDVRTEDPAAQQDLLTQPSELTFKHNPMATDIESILGGVDTYNKHKVQMIIIKKNNRNREERVKITAALAAAQAKVSRAVLYFRKTYTENALQNIAKAYQFTELLKE